MCKNIRSGWYSVWPWGEKKGEKKEDFCRFLYEHGAEIAMISGISFSIVQLLRPTVSVHVLQMFWFAPRAIVCVRHSLIGAELDGCVSNGSCYILYSHLESATEQHRRQSVHLRTLNTQLQRLGVCALGCWHVWECWRTDWSMIHLSLSLSLFLSL